MVMKRSSKYTKTRLRLTKGGDAAKSRPGNSSKNALNSALGLHPSPSDAPAPGLNAAEEALLWGEEKA